MTPRRPGRRRVLAVALGGLFPTGRPEASPQGTRPAARDAKRDPKLTEEERKALLLEVHKLIETAADQAFAASRGASRSGSFPIQSAPA